MDKKKRILFHMIALGMIICMSLADVSMYVRLIMADPSDTFIVEEKRELSKAMADGEWTGKGSDYPVGGDDTYDDVKEKTCFNILEIVPDKRMAMVGFTIAGCEPYDPMILDALVNKKPGDEQEQYAWCPKLNGVALTDLAMNTGSSSAMYYIFGEWNGYYEYVGPDEGVYAIVSEPNGNRVSYDSNNKPQYVKDIIMQSKYADNKGSVITGYDYKWVEGDQSLSFETANVAYKTAIKYDTNGNRISVADEDKIYVYKHAKHKYVNNELFLCTMSNFCPGLDGAKGICSGVNNYGSPSYASSYSLNSYASVIEEWRKDNAIKVYTKEPGEVTTKDVDEADFIIICRGDSDGSYNMAFRLYNSIHGTGGNKKEISSQNDFSTNVLKSIYKHVVGKSNDQPYDCAIAYSCETAPSPQYFNTNVGRLGCMLFYINNSVADEHLAPGESKAGTGRDFFRNLLPDYEQDANGNVIEENSKIDTIGDKKTTDYLYINGSGKLIINGSESLNGSGGWDEGNQKFNDNWMFTDELKKKYLKYSYDVWDNWGHKQTIKIDGLGFYALDSYIKGRYRNQLFYTEDYALYKYSEYGGGAKDLKAINSNPTHTRHVTSEGTTKKNCYLTMNIVNGDSVTSKLGTPGDINKNKTIYVNKYELKNLSELPLDIEVETTHKIKKITVKKDGAVIGTYKTPAGSDGILNGGGFLGAIKLIDDTTYGADGKAPYISGKDYYMYSLSCSNDESEGASIKIPKSYFENGSNNTIYVEVTNEVGKTVSDKITIVTRDFFMLN